MRPTEEPFPVLHPDLQISFYYKFKELEQTYLHEALRRAINEIQIDRLDDELGRIVAVDSLRRVASFGLRGEIFFATPYLLRHSPTLLDVPLVLWTVS